MESKREIKHILVVKFNEGATEQQIEECIKQFCNLVDLVPSIKAFKWGKEMGIVNLNQGFTHVFEATFESAEDVAAYVSNPNHANYASLLMPLVEKFVVLDFEPVGKPQP
ncbi:stress-response A/B barrel domain-containing protein HS1-like [Salvia miltiorrhiza]|uniref:stress-response A/B barrel domain-containing protein HS1-like n=1 Tax=Salvia miltiorrhiza TaxID=226208 RepID=UPI0025ACE113|nr:stress-response A/B barrel domain-containing protein HS1-like [Salvia miltiorrhiza]